MDILFIIFLLVAIGIAILAAESDSWVYTTTVFISTFAALDFVFGVPIWATILSNPLTIIMFTFIYVAVGAAYTAIWRWPVALRDKSEQIQDSYESYLKNHKEHNKKDFIDSNAYSKYTASYNKSSLANWVLAWPFSLAWELARKPAIWLWNNIYHSLGNLFEHIGKSVTNKILQDK